MSRRAVLIAAVEPDGVAARAGLRLGDRVVAVCDEEPWDSLDFELLASEPEVPVVVRRQGRLVAVVLTREWGQGLGLAVTHRPRACRLACRFCFVEQQPRGLRRSLCLKDDDYSLSFRDGFFVTLSNLDEEDLERIVACQLSPLFVSVHATDPAARARLLRPRGPAGRDVLPALRFLAESDIELHLQVVLVPGYNDGAVLQQTLADLLALGPAVQSIGVVPVGLTRYQRDPTLRRFSAKEARALLQALAPVAEEAQARAGRPVVMAADEWYLLAGRVPPPARAYGGFPQLENGVGLVRQFLDGLRRLQRRVQRAEAAGTGGRDLAGRHVALLTGVLAAPLVARLAAFMTEATGARVEVWPVVSSFWGETVTVAGLLTGADVRAALTARLEDDARPDAIFLPAVMVSDEGALLDGVKVAALASETGLPLDVVAPDPESLWQEMATLS